MVPVYDTDVEEERWAREAWKHYEFWEKVEKRFRRKRLILIVSATIVFLVLSSIPVIMDRMPHWRALSLTRELALKISDIKFNAIIEKKAHKITFLGSDGLNFIVEKAETCSDFTWTKFESGRLSGNNINQSDNKGEPGDFYLLSTIEGEKINVPGVVRHICYEPLGGSGFSQDGIDLVGLGIIPRADLENSRLDRIVLLLIDGQTANISIDSLILSSSSVK